MKFGGTSVGSAERMKAACDLIAEAARNGAALVIGQPYTAIGPSPQLATSVTRAKPGQGAWPADQ